MKDSRGPGGGNHGAISQNLSLEWPSVWGGKSFKFLGKMKDSRDPGGGTHGAMSQNLKNK